MVHHILVVHRGKEEAPYYCAICEFKAMDLNGMVSHVKRYQLHSIKKVEKKMETVNDADYFVRNGTAARRFVEGSDLTPWTTENSRKYWAEKMGSNFNKKVSSMNHQAPATTTVKSTPVRQSHQESTTRSTDVGEVQTTSMIQPCLSMPDETELFTGVPDYLMPGFEAIIPERTERMESMVRELFGPHDPTQPPSPRSTTSLGSTPKIHLEEDEELPIPTTFPTTKTAEQETNTEKPIVQDRGCDPIEIPPEISPVMQTTLNSIASRLDQLTGLVLDNATVIHSSFDGCYAIQRRNVFVLGLI